MGRIWRRTLGCWWWWLNRSSHTTEEQLSWRNPWSQKGGINSLRERESTTKVCRHKQLFCTVGWSDIALFGIFENGLIATDYIYFYKLSFEKSFSLAARAAKFLKIIWILKMQFFPQKFAKIFFYSKEKSPKKFEEKKVELFRAPKMGKIVFELVIFLHFYLEQIKEYILLCRRLQKRLQKIVCLVEQSKGPGQS